MLATLLLTVGFFALAMAAMAIGVALTGKRLAGSCGGTGGAACSCSPEKQARCREKALTQDFGGNSDFAESLDEEDEAVFNPLARPGEERLIQLSRR